MQRHNDNFSVSKILRCPVAIPDYIPAADWSRKKKIFRCNRISLWVSAGSGTLCVQMHVFAFCFHGMGNLRCRIPNQAWSVLFSNHGKAFVIKILSETNCSTFIFGSQEKWGIKWRAEWLKRNVTPLVCKISIQPDLKRHFLPKNTKRNPCFQEIPLFAGSIYFTLPEIVMGPIWVPNASINTSWTNLGILIIGRKDILKIFKEFSSNF